MCGQYGNYGTGSFQIVLDMNEMEKHEAFDTDVSDNVTEIEKAFTSASDNTECYKSQIVIQNNVANIKPSGETGVCDDDYNMGF